MKRGSNTVIPYTDIDYELVELIKCMNNIEGIETVECCCGHGTEPCQIWFVADSVKDVTHFIHDYLYRSLLWRITIDITDVDIDENKWDNPIYLLETTCKDYYYTGVCIDNLTYKIKMKQHEKQQFILDKIRADIEERAKINQNLNTDRARALCWCLDVIDKYKAESEE